MSFLNLSISTSVFLFLFTQALCLQYTPLSISIYKKLLLSLGSRGTEARMRRVQWDIDLRHRLARFVPCKSEFKVCHARKELGMRGSITACVRFRSLRYSRRSWFERYEKSFVLKMHWILNNILALREIVLGKLSRQKYKLIVWFSVCPWCQRSWSALVFFFSCWKYQCAIFLTKLAINFLTI